MPGHWEGDLVIGCDGTAIGTLVERSTRFTILLHLPGDHSADTVAAAMIREMGGLPDHLRRSIAWDRGTELAGYARSGTALETTLYFCDPHSPWQRGTNENTNRLLRFWFEKGSDLSVHTPGGPPPGRGETEPPAPAHPQPRDPSQPAEPAAARSLNPGVAPTT